MARIFEYSTVGEIIAALKNPPKPSAGDHSRSKDATEEWDLGAGYKDALAMLSGGWAEGASKVYELSDRLAVAPPQSERLGLEPSVAGCIPNVPAYLAGDVESMYTPIYTEAVSPNYVTLYLPVGYAWNVDAESAFNRGAGFAALVDALENAGNRVRVYAYAAVLVPGENCVFTFLLKDYADPLDVDSLIFQAAHPAFLRRIWFGLAERSTYQPLVEATRGGYGRPYTATADELRVDDDAVVFGHMKPADNGKSPEYFLRETIASLPAHVAASLENVAA